MLFGFVSAGPGIKWNSESVVVLGEEKTCLKYWAYNPWEKDSNVIIGFDEALSDKIDVYESRPVLVPAKTSSEEAIPVKVCFKTKACEETEIISGEVLITEIDSSSSGQSSLTSVSVSAPLKIEVSCLRNLNNLGLVYFGLAVICATVVIFTCRKKKCDLV